MIRILWVVNIVLPQAAHLVDGKVHATGGWINAMIQQVAKLPGVQLAVATRAPVAAIKRETIDGIEFFLLPQGGRGGFDVAEADCQSVLKEFAPDLLHVEGTEFAHAKTFLRNWAGPNIVSLQGIINGYEPYQYGGLPVGEMLFSGKSVPALAALSLIYRKQRLFMPRLKDEVETIGLAKNILGRTTWDRAHAYAINPTAPYFSCNRILRDVFYSGLRWHPNEMERHSIFIGNSSSPLKGAHFVLHAAAQLKREYPDVKLYIAGEDPYPKGGSKLKKMISYPAYLRYLVDQLGLQGHVEFTGILQADAMADRLRRSNVYVLCSSIENSPNTLGEAMILGVPCVSAFTGGAQDMATDGVEALFYRDNDPKLMAYQIKRIFDNAELAQGLSERGPVRARKTHDPVANMNNTVAAYEQILNVSLRSEAVAK